MKTTLNSTLALVALAALTIYILACGTAFSPDDKKVLYPAFDPSSGAIGVAVYDRESGRSEMLFVPVAFKKGGDAEVEPSLLRPQWLADGRNILVTGTKPDSDDSLNLTVLPVGGQASVRMYALPAGKKAAEAILLPTPVTGNRVFIMVSSNLLARLDVTTGSLVHHEFQDLKGNLTLYPSPKSDAVFYVEEQGDGKDNVVFGRINADSFARTSLMTITNQAADGGFFTFSADGKRVAMVEKAGDLRRLIVLEDGRTVFARPLTSKGEKLAFGSAAFLPKGDALCASFLQSTEGQDAVSLGLMEIPLNDTPVRRTVLIKTTGLKDDSAALYFQAGFSHDGKTAGLASTYLACDNKDFKPEDCALFLVDLSDPNRKVTKVLIPLPVKNPAPAGK